LLAKGSRKSVVERIVQFGGIPARGQNPQRLPPDAGRPVLAASRPMRIGSLLWAERGCETGNTGAGNAADKLSSRYCHCILPETLD
jgi:hypothetical protein